MEMAVELGHPQAIGALGYALFSNEMGVHDEKRGVELLHKAVDLDDGFALSVVGAMYLDGYCGKDARKGALYLVRAVAKGYEQAMFSLGHCYKSGDGVKKDLGRAFKLFDAAVAKGSVEAMVDAGVCYYNGDGTERDTKKALTYFQKAVSTECIRGYYYLGYCYEFGVNIMQDSAKAMHLYDKAAAGGCREACADLGCRYLIGDGVIMDRIRGVHLLEIAAEQQEQSAMKRLAYASLYGEGIQKDAKRCVMLLHQCVSVDDDDHEAKAMLGLCSLLGIGVTKDEIHGGVLIDKSHDAGECAGSMNLAYLYEHGIGRPSDVSRAVQLYSALSDANDPDACVCLGNMHRDGRGVTQDMTKAIQLYTKASDQGSMEALLSLGVIDKQHLDKFEVDLSVMRAVQAMADMRLKNETPSFDFESSNMCVICLEPVLGLDDVSMACGHSLCHCCGQSYFGSLLKKSAEFKCPLCDKSLEHNVMDPCTRTTTGRCRMRVIKPRTVKSKL